MGRDDGDGIGKVVVIIDNRIVDLKLKQLFEGTGDGCEVGGD